MEPINYLANVPNPAGAVFQGLAAGTAQQANEQQMAQAMAQEARAAEMQPYAVQGAQLGLDAGRQNMTVQADANTRANEMQPLQVQQAQQQIAQQQRAVEFQGAAAGLAALGPDMTIADLQSVVTKFPEYGEAVVGSFQAMNQAQQQSVVNEMAAAAFALKNGYTATAIDLMEDYVLKAEASGNAEIAATARAIQQTAEMDFNAALMSLVLPLEIIAPEALARILDTGAEEPADVRALRIRAAEAGLVRGTSEYSQFMLNAGSEPATFRALDLQAQAAGLSKGTPEYAEFMATRGAGDQAFARVSGENQADIQTGRLAAQEVAAGSTLGAALASIGVDAQQEAPSIITKSQAGMELIDSIASDRNLPSILGPVQGRLTAGTPLTGGEAGADLMAKIQQLQGQAFLTAFESLKGGGTITEVEGLKAELALARLQRTQSPEGFRQSLAEFRSVLEAAKLRAEGNLVPDVFNGTPFPTLGTQPPAPAAPPAASGATVPSYLQNLGGQ